MTMAAGIGVLCDEEYTKNNCKAIIENREYAINRMKKSGFSMTPSLANFIFAKHEKIGGEEIYKKLREKGILVRHFSKGRLDAYNRITVGTREQMEALVEAVREIVGE